MLNDVKLALRISTTAFDNEISMLIGSAKNDLGIAGVDTESSSPIVKRAIITYCRMNFGEPTDYDRLKKAYDEMKAQLAMSSEFNAFGDN